ncbi:MAG TPA: transposase [Rhodoferax sp.]|nr:transposase [Rhodoferax sp.]
MGENFPDLASHCHGHFINAVFQSEGIVPKNWRVGLRWQPNWLYLPGEIGCQFVQLAGIDGAGWHSSKKFLTPPNNRLLALPPYAPELNPVEHLWDELRVNCFHNKVFASLGALEDDLAMGLLAMENTPEVVQSIANWSWTIDVLSKWKEN